MTPKTETPTKSECRVCHLGPFTTPAVALYRQNAPGQVPAIWACEIHNRQAVDAEVQEIVDIIEAAHGE